MIKAIYVQSGTNKAYGLVSDTLQLLSEDWTLLNDDEKVAAFNSCDDGSSASFSVLSTIGKFKVYSYITGSGNVVGIARPIEDGPGEWVNVFEDEEGVYIPHCNIIALPKAQIIRSTGLLPLSGAKIISNISINGNFTEEIGKVVLAVTTDLNEYKTYNFTDGVWEVIDQDSVDELLSRGIDANQVSNIPSSAWEALGSIEIGFLYCIKQNSLQNKVFVDSIEAGIKFYGIWEKDKDCNYKYTMNDNNKVDLVVSINSSGSYKINYTNEDNTRLTTSTSPSSDNVTA